MVRVIFITNNHTDDPHPNYLFDRDVKVDAVHPHDLRNDHMDIADFVLLGYYMDTDGLLGNWLADYVDQGGKVLATYINFQIRHAPRGRWQTDNYSPLKITHDYAFTGFKMVIPDDVDHDLVKMSQE